MKQQIQLRRREAVDGVELPADLPPLLQRLYASRGVRSAQELERSVKGMLPWTQLTGVEKAVEMLHDAFQKGLHIVVVGDFDADGATSTALSVLALRALGYGNVSYLVPNRFEDGYGLSPEVVDQAHARGAQMIMTVDNGISSHAGVDHAHLPGVRLLGSPPAPPCDALVASHACRNRHLRCAAFPCQTPVCVVLVVCL
ncbi:DHH family phosphoesterase, partial [Klebsiella pneumoniae]